jgi:hypothetical protein
VRCSSSAQTGCRSGGLRSHALDDAGEFSTRILLGDAKADVGEDIGSVRDGYLSRPQVWRSVSDGLDKVPDEAREAFLN